MLSARTDAFRGLPGLVFDLLRGLLGLLLGLRLDVQLVGQGVNRRGQPLTRLLNVGLDLFRRGVGRRIGGRCGCGGTHRRALSLISSTSFLTLSTVPVGTGGAALATFLLPNNAAMPAAIATTTATISAASQAGSIRANAKIAVARKQPSANQPSTAAAPKAPMPTPAVLAFSVISACASLSSPRSSRLDSSDTCLINSAIDWFPGSPTRPEPAGSSTRDMFIPSSR